MNSKTLPELEGFPDYLLQPKRQLTGTSKYAGI